MLSDKQFWLKAWGGGFQLQLCCLGLEASFLFVSSAAALILLSPGAGWGGNLERVGPGIGNFQGLRAETYGGGFV